MHPAFIGAQYPFSVATGPHPPMAATAVTFPGVPVPSMTQIAVHPYHTETGLPLSTTVAGQFANAAAVAASFRHSPHPVCLNVFRGAAGGECESCVFLAVFFSSSDVAEDDHSRVDIQE